MNSLSASSSNVVPKTVGGKQVDDWIWEHTMREARSPTTTTQETKGTAAGQKEETLLGRWGAKGERGATDAQQMGMLAQPTPAITEATLLIIKETFLGNQVGGANDSWETM